MLDGPMLRQRKLARRAESDGCASAGPAATAAKKARRAVQAAPFLEKKVSCPRRG
jgi:hypothetical protein